MSESTSARPFYLPGIPAEIEPVTRPLGSLLWQSAKDYPNRIAIDFLGRTITYSELAHQTRKAAVALYRCGVRSGDVVALIMPNCPQHVVAFYAALSLGAVVAEHNPLAPSAELHEQLARHGAKVVVVWEQTLAKLTEDGDDRGRTYLSIDLSRELPHFSRLLLTLPVASARAQRAKLRADVPHGILSFDRVVKKAPSASQFILKTDSGIDLDSRAVLIHTGGTTGVPKAVQLTHRNLMANITQTTLWIQGVRRGEEVFAGVLPFFHAFGLQTVLGVGISQAATLVILPNFDVSSLLAGQRRYPITLFPGVAPMFERVLAQAVKEREAGKATDLTSIKWAFSGAMALDPDLATRWEEATGGFIIEGYGMSEASPIIAGSPVSINRRPSTLGIPFPSTEIRLADPDDPSKDATDVGEILVRGPQVFSGYLGEPDETAAVFHDGWLRTGDLGRWDDGFLVMADRRKEMIIHGGFNVYPSQVEDAIKSMPGVRDVAVVGMPDENRGESVVAVLVLEPDTIVDIDAVRRWTQDKLSHYAMPKSIAIAEDLPRSQLGKVLRRAVRDELQEYELKSGEWRKKAAELTEATSDKLEALTASVAESVSELSLNVTETWHATKEQLQEKLTLASEQISQATEQLNARLKTDEDGRIGFGLHQVAAESEAATQEDSSEGTDPGSGAPAQADTHTANGAPAAGAAPSQESGEKPLDSDEESLH